MELLDTSGGFYGFVPRLGRQYRPPTHLDPLVQALELALRQSVRRTAHAPPRHAKTDTVLAFIAYALLLRPDLTHGYITYADALAKSKSSKARNWALQQGLHLAPGAKRLNEWRTAEGGGLLAGGAGGPLTGQGITGILFVDDPYKDRVQAESAAYKARIIDWWNDVAETRLEPGASAFVFHTRWTSDDLIGHIHDGEGASEWEHIHLPAISHDGRALWPDRMPLEWLLKKQLAVGEYTWQSLYQGVPRSRGTSVFGPVHFFALLPAAFRVAIGIDLAYSEKTSADYSVAVVLAEAAGVFYVLEVVRLQVRAPDFAIRLKALREKYAGAPIRFIGAGTEIGSVDFLQRDKIPVQVKQATGDKFLRAQLCAAAWNDKKILLPTPAEKQPLPWVVPFVTEVCGFSGVRDKNDDQVDALVAAHDALLSSTAPPSAFDKLLSKVPSLRS